MDANFFHNRICIPANLEAHESPLTAHPGYHKMFASLKQSFFWPRMKKDTLEYQEVKTERVKLPEKTTPFGHT